MEALEPPCVVGIVGHSNTGKTTLLECLVPALCAHGLAVGAVKHASHGFCADRPGKDSHRIYESGAKAVALVSGTKLATFVRRDPGEPRLLEALVALPDGLDLVLVEGFSWEPMPRIVLVRQGMSPAEELLARGAVLRVLDVPEPDPGCQPVFSTDLVASLAKELAIYAEMVRGTRSRVQDTRSRVRDTCSPVDGDPRPELGIVLPEWAEEGCR